MTLRLGIDGGGSGCRAAVADATGKILGRGAAGPANIASNLSEARDNILAATRAALQAAGQPEAIIAQLQAGLGLAGANAAGAEGQLRLGLPFRQMRIESDAVAAAKGALGQADGIVAALGTGSVFAVQRQGHIRCYGGWGLALGDEGSGARLGRAALSRALQAVDGFVEMTPFLAELIAEHQGAAGVVSYSLTARPADYARLAPRLLASADAAATALLNEAVAEVRSVLTALRRDCALPVTFIGGLGPSYANRLSDLPQSAALGSALDGALILASEAV